MSNHYLFVDLETTGLDHKRHEIIQLAAILVPRGEFFAYEPSNYTYFEAPVYPQNIETADPKALEIARYDADIWAKQGLWLSEAMRAMRDMVPTEGKTTIAGHNVSFDVGFLEAAWEKFPNTRPENLDYHTLDTASLARVLEFQGKIQSVSLRFVAKHFGIEQHKAHDALSDARTSLAIAQRLLDSARRGG